MTISQYSNYSQESIFSNAHAHFNRTFLFVEKSKTYATNLKRNRDDIKCGRRSSERLTERGERPSFALSLSLSKAPKITSKPKPKPKPKASNVSVCLSFFLSFFNRQLIFIGIGIFSIFPIFQATLSVFLHFIQNERRRRRRH